MNLLVDNETLHAYENIEEKIMSKIMSLTFILWQFSVLGFAQIRMIPNVPDHSQPPAITLSSTLKDSTNYCAPFAHLNIVDYLENVYLHPNAQGMMGGLTPKEAVEYIGWFLDTNNNGDTTRANGTIFQKASGTYTIDESEGMRNYVLFDPQNLLGFPFPAPPMKIAYPWDISPPMIEDFPIYMGEIDMGHLVKLDFLYWNPIPTGDTVFVTDPPDTILVYKWGPQIPNTGGMEDVPWEEWNLEMDPERNIGHAVTGVGSIMDTLEFAIVHDNWSTTPKNIAIPWRNMQTGIPYVTAMIFVLPNPAIVQVSLPDTTAYTGDKILIPIEIEDLTGLHVLSYVTNVLFDTTVLKATGATAVNSLSASWGSPNVILSTPGEIYIVGSGISELAGAGNLVFLEFDVVGNIGDSTHLGFKTMAFNFGDPVADTLGGSLEIVPRQIGVTISSNPVGLSIEVDGSPYTTPKIFNWNQTDSHQLNALSPQPGASGIRYSYDSWSNNGSQQQNITVPNKDTTFTAIYNTEYQLTASVNPIGSGTVNITPNPEWFLSDSSAFLEAVPQTNYTFNDWSGDLTGSENPDTLLMDNPKNVTANFNIIIGLSQDSPEEIPETFALYQNHPNPFNPITNIAFDLPEACQVKLKIYNIIGEEVVTLVSDRLPAGKYNYTWNMSYQGGMASGIYLYILEAKDYVETKKMVLMK